ncbi:hypothetical protein LCGC14_2397880, partial [marine sediment metagenome]
QGEENTTYVLAAPDGGFKDDSIGDACDSEQGGSDTVADGAFLHDIGKPASSALVRANQVYQFFPPLIMAERQISLGVISSSIASAARVRARIYYRTVHIDSSEFVEIAEVFRLVS